ncbi:MAG: archease [Wenzhouxiangellaceae bacterium]|nr:archease [Wenzhouxiangellaceae bacterium]
MTDRHPDSLPARDDAAGAAAPAAVGGWEHFEHVADIGIRGCGATLEQAFAQAAVALTAVICDPADVVPRECVEIDCAADDREMLLVEWIDAIVYEMATRGMLFSRFEVNVTGNRLRGRLHGEPIDVARHRPAVEVKGATLTELEVGRDAAGRWRAQLVIDV